MQWAAMLRVADPRSGTWLKTRMNGSCGVPVEHHFATDAIRLHTPDFKLTQKIILFPGNKKVRFFNFFAGGCSNYESTRIHESNVQRSQLNSVLVTRRSRLRYSSETIIFPG